MSRREFVDIPTHIATHFGVVAASARLFGNGHINDTYLIEATPARYILQRVNDHVFTRPIELMENVGSVTRHVRARLEAEGARDIDRRVLTLLPTIEGADYHVDPYGQVWRLLVYIGGATSHEIATSPTQAFEAARAFGRFQQLLSDYDGPRLHETIPHFHDTPTRYRDFVAIVEADPVGRLAGVRREVDWLLDTEDLAGAMLRLRDEGAVAERITHNDSKLSNVLMDDITGEALCVVDLDTVMPGLSLYDFADLCRSGATTVPEDAPDASGLDVDVPMFQALAEGYLAGAGSALLPSERLLLVRAGQVMTLEQAYRFLGDHLAGDAYYQISRPGQNLDRARTQIALVNALRRRESELTTYLARLR